MADILEPHCGCGDCEAAVSPGAYLAHLIDYVLQHVRNNGATIDLPYLVSRFHQPFADLPLDCDAADEKVHQVRLAVEVLRSDLGPRPLFDTVADATLSEDEAQYRLVAYLQLLTQLGTTYEEVRRARVAPAADRAALADRLGLSLTTDGAVPRQDELDRLLLDPALPDTDPQALTERALERLFGLADIGRDHLSHGVKSGDAQSQLLRWNFTGGYLDRNTGPDGLVHLSLASTAPTVFTIAAFADEARTRLVAIGTRASATGPVRLVPQNGSALSGIVHIDYKADDATASLSILPAMLAWRLRNLRRLWREEDWPSEPLPSTGRLPPLVDPQVIGAGDFSNPQAGDPAFDFWVVRTAWLAAERAALKSAREAAADERTGLEAIVAQALTVPGRAVTVADLDAIDAAQREGERIEERLDALGLGHGAFALLMPILGLVRAGQPIIAAEWEIVYDTLLAARKQLQFDAWRSAEKTAALTLSPSHFRVGDPAGAPEQAVSPAVALWLSTRDARRNWIDVLEARIGQETTVAAAVASAVSRVEDAALPLLRDALVTASDAEGETLDQRAEWLTGRLLIDLRMAGTQPATRVAQAIETLQELLFGLRTGQLELDTLVAFAPLVSIGAAAQGDGRIDLFGRGEDNVLWHRVWQGRWRGWKSYGALPGSGAGIGPSEPAVVVHDGGVIDLVVRGAGRVLWHRRYDRGWSGWQRVPDDLELVGNPAAVWRAGQLEVLALRIGDLQVMQRRFDGATWTPWVATGAVSSRSPAATSWAADRLDVFLAHQSPALFKPLHRFFDDVAWQEEDLDSTISDPAAATRGVDHLDLFQNRFGHLLQKSFDVTWQPWVDLDSTLTPADPQLRGTPSAYSSAAGTLDVFAIRSGPVESSLWRRRFAAGAWAPWEVLPSSSLELDAPDFEAEWLWIGSYSSWRSAMFASLYPDNLLLPSLISRQTPAFRKLVEATRPTRRLQPEDARQQARAYSTYLRDVSALAIAASCQVDTTVASSSPSAPSATVSKKLYYLFGKTMLGKIYWCTVDSQDKSGYAQSFWEEVPLAADGKAPPFEVIRIVGALPWLNRTLGQHHIYLFLDVRRPNGRSLERIRFDLDRYGREDAWDPSPVELDLPTFLHPGTGKETATRVDQLTALPVQSNRVSEPPRLAVHLHQSTFAAYVRALGNTGDGWETGNGDGWGGYQVSMKTGFPAVDHRINELEAALRVNGTNWIVYRHNPGGGFPWSRMAFAAPNGGWNLGADPETFRGALPGRDSDETIFLFYDEDGQTIYREIGKSAGPGVTFIPAPGWQTLTKHSGSFSPTFFVTPSAGGGHSYGYWCQASGGQLIGSTKFDLLPRVAAANEILVGLSVPQLQNRRFSIKGVYGANQGASASILQYLVEAYRLVPLQLALNMQASGEFVAALDWYATVYDYRAARGTRDIDYGLAIDAGLPDTAIFQHAADWLLDPLNPHAVALTRRYAYTRFTIASIVGCLNEFADAEFTTDTDESLVRARLMYTTAIELCDEPEMRQHLGACDAVLGNFSIEPGEIIPPAVAAALGAITELFTIGRVGGFPGGLSSLDKIKSLVATKAWATMLPALNEIVTAALASEPLPNTTATVVAERPAMMAAAHSRLLTDPAVEAAARAAGEIAVARAFAGLEG